ncbi:uncharacterized protein [Diadema antillarum]|uniref:uncharacterized protein n=1 Tax=Diadema antillarum TaxID=105358 RepID=UPI003A842C78
MAVSFIHPPEPLEVLWLQIKPCRLPREISSIFVTIIYYPQPDREMAAQLIDHMQIAVDQILTKHPDAAIVMLGDFNQLDLNPFLCDVNFRQVVDKPTRGERILDKIVTNVHARYNDPHILAPLGRSDHSSVWWTSREPTPPSNSSQTRMTRPMKDSSIRAFGQWISNHDWEEINTDDSVSEQCANFYATLHTAIEKHFPMRRVKLHPTDKDWMTPKIKAMIKSRQKAFSCRNTAVYKHYRNKVSREIATAKSTFYSTKIQNLKTSNPAAWYRGIRSMTSGKIQPTRITVPDVDSENYIEISQRINEGFASYSADLIPINPSRLPAYLPSRHPVPLIQPWEVYRELKSIKQSRSGGPDGISARLIKEFAYELSCPLTKVLNCAFGKGIFPDVWKRAIITPVPKTSPATIDGIRPISLTDHFAKLAEGFIAKWTLDDMKPSLDSHQSGNRRGMSTSHCLVSLLHELYLNADKPKSSSTIVLTDFAKAFDHIDHGIAIQKLLAMNVRPCVVQLIANFLSDRKQCVRYFQQLSEWISPHGGVPQGTKLGPIIFLAMINNACLDDPESSPALSIYKYVDDLTLVECRQSEQRPVIQEAVDDLCEWSRMNNMDLNPKKCVTMEFCFSRNHPDPHSFVSTTKSFANWIV